MITPSPLTIPGLESPQVEEFYYAALGYLNGFDFSGIVSDVKTIAIIVSVILGTILVWIMIKMGDLYKNKLKEAIDGAVEGLTPPAEAVTAYDNRWQEIRRHVDSFVDAEWKLAIVEADKFVDDILKTAGFAGESMGERLMMIKPDQIANIQYLWDAHKIRNLLVHDANFRLTHQQALFAINAFESVLKELGALN
ncbi:MAG: hypothetical protein A2831_01040 [Candidatus Yanofskybacteria bacterium RIFCSPHIGHO2_01_FULL_44_17]|uniref:Uncharacterized protein n=1 Tax=Candidatus Yanofskybacteria bacterium RIFCSPHIGHO2_01_FULL_44_17 TaxID=1802668 RepID=A0A1F8EUA3_9BACT|nr:MAG: hypothetical protein A2831_01040 [Candidatus Yanofskybacteria bacterium RIFCSPHIGHO2_01_FULL_44_17]